MKNFFLFGFLLLFSLFFTVSCKKKNSKNQVDLRQIEVDGSTNDTFLFREQLLKEKKRNMKIKRKNNDFK